MVEKHAVVVSRQWHQPDIRIAVTHESIAIQMALPDFLAAIAAEMAHPLTTWTRAQLAEQLTGAALRVTASMKGETARVM